MTTENSLIYSSGEMHRFRTSDVSQATLASVAPVFTVVSMDGTFDNLQKVLPVLIKLTGVDWSAKIILIFCFIVNHYTCKSCRLCVLFGDLSAS